jgi:hypothetical protein
MLENHQLRGEPAKMAALICEQTGYVAIGPTPANTTQEMLDRATSQALFQRDYLGMRRALRVPAPQVHKYAVTQEGCEEEWKAGQEEAANRGGLSHSHTQFVVHNPRFVGGTQVTN